MPPYRLQGLLGIRMKAEDEAKEAFSASVKALEVEKKKLVGMQKDLEDRKVGRKAKEAVRLILKLPRVAPSYTDGGKRGQLRSRGNADGAVDFEPVTNGDLGGKSLKEHQALDNRVNVVLRFVFVRLRQDRCTHTKKSPDVFQVDDRPVHTEDLLDHTPQLKKL